MIEHWLRKVISWCVVITLISGAALAGVANSPVVGRVLQSSGATLGGVVVPDQGTILKDDVLSTRKGGRALVEFSPTTRASVLEVTLVRLGYARGNPSAQISSGMMVTTTLGKDALIVETPKYRIEPADQGKAIHVVAVLPDKSTVVAARSGGVSITEISSGQRYVLPEGQYAEISAASAGVPGQEGAGRPGSGKPKKRGEGWHIGSLSHGTSIALVVGAAAAAAIAIPLAIQSPASPSEP